MSEVTQEMDVAADAASGLRPAPITLGRVTRYFELLCRLGFADVFDEIAQKRARPKNQGKPTKSLADELKPPDEEEGEFVSINLGLILREVARNGALLDLGEIIFEAGEGTDADGFRSAIDDCTSEVFRPVFFGFARESHGLLGELVAFGASSV